ncbi:MAG: hypothetical protein IJU35_03460 [Paludibacteraceae bacterium]|nr:hypothetical protein [Paludibacteraceae bacterium]
MNEGLLGNRIGNAISKGMPRKKRFILAGVMAAIIIGFIATASYFTVRERQPVGEPYTVTCVFTDASLFTRNGIVESVSFEFKSAEQKDSTLFPREYAVTEYMDREDRLIQGKELVKREIYNSTPAMEQIRNEVLGSKVQQQPSNPNDIGASVHGKPLLIGDTCTLTIQKLRDGEENVIDVIVRNK